MKTIDKYLIKQFIGPFVTTFFIALFVLMMQFIWVYVDDMVGKGAGFGLVLEIIIYNSISLIPWALPIAILISSVMVMGNLGERYELASLKSAGVSLTRIMRPMLYFGVGVAIFSFFASNNLVPVANLKFKSRLHDIRTQKPTLNLEEGVFNDDFGGFIIHIGKKDKDNRSIQDVIIYDHQNYTNKKLSMITAESGEMYMTDDNAYFIMNLKNGFHYQEGDKAKGKEKEKYPFMRTKFAEWNKVFDTKEFNIDLTDMDRFKNHYTMLSVGQLYNAIDSIDKRIVSYHTRLDEYVQKTFYPLKQIIVKKKREASAKKLAEQKKLAKQQKKKNPTDTKIQKNKTRVEKQKNTKAKKVVNKKKFTQAEIDRAQKARDKLIKKKPKQDPKAKERMRARAEKAKAESAKKKKKREEREQPIKQEINKELKEYDSFYQLFPESERERFSLKDRAKTTARGILSQSEAIQRSINPKKENRVKHIFVLYSKFSFALVCCVFLFIGAPMGAIVRKGGFGYPLLIAILFFMVFIVLNILFQKLAESYVLPALLAAWCPILILLPIGYILTSRAMADKKIVNLDRYTTKIKSLFQFFQKEKTTT